MTATAQEQPGGRPSRTTALAFLTLAGLTLGELKVAAGGAGPGRVTALSALLLVKVSLVLLVCLRADFRRRSAPRLALAALILAVVFVAVLMLEAAFRARVR